MKTNETTLAEIRTLLEKPVLNNNLDYSQGFKMPIAELSTAKPLTFWFGAQSQRALHEGKNHEALEYLISQTHIPRWLVEDRIWISELVRIGIAAISKTATWEGEAGSDKNRLADLLVRSENEKVLISVKASRSNKDSANDLGTLRQYPEKKTAYSACYDIWIKYDDSNKPISLGRLFA